MAINVLLLGARGTGKTTFLASAYYEFKDLERLCPNVSLIDKTHYDAHTHLISRIYELINRFGQNQNSPFALDFLYPSHNIWKYSFRLSDNSASNWINIDFVDISGSMIGYSRQNQMIQEYVRSSDIIVVSIDTPVLMGPVENNPAYHCSENINEVRNGIHEILNYLASIDSQKSVTVVFMPVKCEKWIAEGRLSEVYMRIEEVFKNHINMLNEYPKVSIAIIPVQTLGNIIFEEFSKFQVLRRAENPHQLKQCTAIGKRVIRLADGSLYRLREGDTVEEDVGAFIPELNVPLPSEWYRTTDDKQSFDPKNCANAILMIARSFIENYLSRFRNRFIIFEDFTGTRRRMEGLLRTITPIIKDNPSNIKFLKRE